MRTYKTNIRLKDAGSQDYEQLDREMETKSFVRAVREGVEWGREYQYSGSGTLPEITAAAYRAARSTGKEYSFTIIRQKGGLLVGK